MSADNGHIISRVNNFNPARPKYGIFYYYASIDDSAENYNEDRALNLWDKPIDAILNGLRFDNDNPTEYGTYVNSLVVADAQREYKKRNW